MVIWIHHGKTYVWLLCLVDCASLYNLVNKAKLVHNFSYYVYFFSLHVSSDSVHIIRRNNCIYAILGICHSLWMTVWYAGWNEIPPCIPVAPTITGIIVHFRFHIHCISIHKRLYFNFNAASSSCTTFLSAGIATSISVHVFSFLFLIIISGLFAVTSVSVCTAWFHNTVTSPSSYTGLGTCVYLLSVVSMPKALHVE